MIIHCENLDLTTMNGAGIVPAFVSGVGSQVVDFYNHQSLLESTIFTSANYIEILAFVAWWSWGSVGTNGPR